MKKTTRYFSAPAPIVSDVRMGHSEDAAIIAETTDTGADSAERLFSEEAKDFSELNAKKRFKKKAKTQSLNIPLLEEEEDDVLVDPEVVKKYRGSDAQPTLDGFRTEFHKSLYTQEFRKKDKRAVDAARAEILLPEVSGFIETEEGEKSYLITQREIVNSVDILSASKQFDLDLNRTGPYRLSYTRNGRKLLLGGRVGHIATIDWITKKLHCEFNVMETVRDVQWLHNELMYAVAQKRWLYIYDHQGKELHCVKKLNNPLRLEFLPYHFLLVSSSATSCIKWLDISMGEIVGSTVTHQGPITAMCSNPTTAVIHAGATSGKVTLWSPTVPKALATMFCHPGALRSVAIDATGTYMATSASDCQIRIWDLRTYRNLYSYILPRQPEAIVFSQKRLLAAGVGTQAQIFKDPCLTKLESPYLVHECRNVVTDLAFCPYEDILGVGHRGGFVSLLIPGAGEPNIDALEANPYQSKKQRQNREVKELLDKIQPEMITLATDIVGRFDETAFERNLDQTLHKVYDDEPKRHIKVKNKMKGKSAPTKMEKRKSLKRGILHRAYEAKRDRLKNSLIADGIVDEKVKKKPKRTTSVLDRFKS